jgi:hypothetical protein
MMLCCWLMSLSAEQAASALVHGLCTMIRTGGHKMGWYLGAA